MVAWHNQTGSCSTTSGRERCKSWLTRGNKQLGKNWRRTTCWKKIGRTLCSPLGSHSSPTRLFCGSQPQAPSPRAAITCCICFPFSPTLSMCHVPLPKDFAWVWNFLLIFGKVYVVGQITHCADGRKDNMFAKALLQSEQFECPLDFQKSAFVPHIFLVKL